MKQERKVTERTVNLLDSYAKAIFPKRTLPYESNYFSKFFTATVKNVVKRVPVLSGEESVRQNKPNYFRQQMQQNRKIISYPRIASES
jgi:hypothetical protein